ncbi:MAG TPA: hypothetical protein DDY78_27980 [Planctomycetales bacterium]|nr:hypothetical protein [Planctomycetales bacterium]
MDSQTKRPIGWLRLGCYFIVLVAVLLTVGVVWFHWDSRPTVRAIENIVTKEGPAVGSTKADVEAWLDARQILNHRRGLNDAGGYPAGLPPTQLCDLSGLEDAEGVVGKIPYEGGLLEFNGEIWIYFFFDKAGQMMKHVVHKWEYFL